MKHLLFLFFFCSSFFLLKAQTTIKMEKTGGVYKVPCKINGLGLKFIFDTGASDVSISLTEAMFMLKNGYLSEADFLGTEYYRIANGDIQEGTKVNFKSIEIGNQKIYNVKASIVHTPDAPLLFGQSALQRFGKFSIDYSTNVLMLGGGTSKAQVNAQVPVLIDNNYCKDIDGNTYKTVEIGKQIWLAENLNVSMYRNRDTLPEAKTLNEWKSYCETRRGCWCYYNNEKTNVCGKLYNWFAVNDIRDLAPAGWHIPSDIEWLVLENYLGNEAGKAIKSINGWTDNGNGTDAVGFAAYPCGGLNSDFGFFLSGSNCEFWSSTSIDLDNAYNRKLNYTSDILYKLKFDKTFGFSVRCIKD